MEIALPSSGCNIYYGTYIDNYLNNTRIRYYINEGQLIESTRSTYSSIPSGYHCLTQGDLVYKPELQIYFGVFSLAIFCLALSLIYKVIIKRLLP